MLSKAKSEVKYCWPKLSVVGRLLLDPQTEEHNRGNGLMVKDVSVPPLHGEYTNSAVC